MLKIALKVNPFDVRSLFEQALTLQGSRRWGEARVVLHRLLSLEPQWAEARLNLGWLEFQNQRYKEAMSAFQGVETLHKSRGLAPPLLAQALSGQALSLEGLGDLSSASSIAQRAIDTQAPAPGAYSLVGRGALAEGRTQEALSAFTVAVREQPMDGPAWWGLSQAQSRLGDPQASRRAAERAAALGISEAQRWLTQPLQP